MVNADIPFFSKNSQNLYKYIFHYHTYLIVQFDIFKLNQAHAWFLKIAFVRDVSMCVCVCVCVSAPRL